MVKMIRLYRGRRGLWKIPMKYSRFMPQLLEEFFMDEVKFIDNFGINSCDFDELHEMIGGQIRSDHTTFPDNIGSRDRLAICLRFMASGISMRELSRLYRIPHKTIPVIIRETSKTISNHLMPIVMKTPTRKMWEQNAKEFENKYNMPNCIGALEGKNLIVNKKKMVFLALVDAGDRFVMVDLGYYRINSRRGNIIDQSKIGKNFAKNKFNVPENKPLTENTEPLPFVMLGSSFFASNSYLMTKYSKPECVANETKRVFNTRISRAKMTVNRALMRLRSRWGVFQGRLPFGPKTATRLVQSCCCLHNLFRLRFEYSFLPDLPNSVIAITEDKLNKLQRLLPQNPKDVRDKFKAYFLSPEGQVPWQWQDIIE